MRTWNVAAIVCLLVLGCGRGTKVVAEPRLADFLAELEMFVGDARGQAESLKSAGAPRPAGSEGGGEALTENPAGDMIASLQAVVSTAEQFALSSAGHSVESDARAIVSDATALLKKSQPTPNADETIRGLEQLSLKIQSVKSRL